MKPNVFVSSTCFDLSQIRTDIEETIEKIGFNPILSDRGSFPVNPNEELITNCINNVSNNADILILIIGNRYGSKSETGKSITNIEYDTARRLGIPIYVFIKKEVLNYLEVWKSNRDGDFSKQVDTTDIFEFVSKIREEDKIWSFEFTNAQDISNIFITQIAFRFKELLDFNKQFNSEHILAIWDQISSKAKKILIHQDAVYEIDFFRQVLLDELNKLEKVKTHYEYNILSTCKAQIDDNFELLKWFRTQLKSLQNYAHTFRVLINELFAKYFGEVGVESDIKGLFLVAQSYSQLMNEMLQWSLDVKNASVPDEVESLVHNFSKFLDNIIRTSWEFPKVLEHNIKSGLERLNKGEKNIEIKVVLNYDIDEEVLSKFRQDFERILNS